MGFNFGPSFTSSAPLVLPEARTMERSSRRLTLRVNIYEREVAGRATLTDDDARIFTGLFIPGLGWNATVRRSSGAGSQEGIAPGTVPAGADFQHPHFVLSLTHRTLYEYREADQRAIETAIDALCRDFCTLNGRLNPRRVNPNPNLTFVPAIDANSPADAIFAYRFCLHTARNTSGGSRAANSIRPSLSSGVSQTISSARSFMTSMTSTIGGIQIAGGTPTALATGLVAVADNSGQSHQASEADERRTRAEQFVRGSIDIRTAFARLENCIQTSTIDLAALKQDSDTFMDAMEVITKQHGDARRQGKLGLLYNGGLVLFTGGGFAGLAQWMGGLGLMGMAESLSDPTALAAVFGVATLFNVFYSGARARTAMSDSQVILKGHKTMHRWLYMILMDVLRSKYQSRPDAAKFVKLLMDMVAALDPQALEGWDSRSTSPEELSRELSSMIRAWQRLTN